MEKPRITWQRPGSDKIHSIPDEAVVILRGEKTVYVLRVTEEGVIASNLEAPRSDFEDPLDNDNFKLV